MTTGPITAAEEARLRQHHCGTKLAMSAAQARNASRRTAHLDAYRCLFADDHVEGGDWHVGHQPCWETVELMARFIRFGVAGARCA